MLPAVKALRICFALSIRSRNEAVGGERAVRADHLVVEEEFDIFLQARDRRRDVPS